MNSPQPVTSDVVADATLARREIRLYFIERKTARERPFVTDGEMCPIWELNWWFFFLRTEQGVSIKTRKQYAYTLCDYYRYCEIIGVKGLNVGHHDLVHYFNDMKETRGVDNNTINSRSNTVRIFYRFLKKKRLIINSPFYD
jgi:site-specific recombinase XerC